MKLDNKWQLAKSPGFYNGTGLTVPPFSCLELDHTGDDATTIEESDQFFLTKTMTAAGVGRPGSVVFNGFFPVLAGAYGSLQDTGMIMAVSNATLSPGDYLKPVAGDFAVYPATEGECGALFQFVSEDGSGTYNSGGFRSIWIRRAAGLKSRYQFQLMSAWSGGLALAYKMTMDGDATTNPWVIVRDPLGIFDFMTAGNPGYMFEECGKYYVFQADCEPATLPDPPTSGGACCIPLSGGEFGCAVMTELACSSAGGTYQGDGTTCTPFPCV